MVVVVETVETVELLELLELLVELVELLELLVAPRGQMLRTTRAARPCPRAVCNKACGTAERCDTGRATMLYRCSAALSGVPRLKGGLN